VAWEREVARDSNIMVKFSSISQNQASYSWSLCVLSALAERSDAVPDCVSTRLSHFLRMFGDTALAGKGFERLDALQRAVRHAAKPGALSTVSSAVPLARGGRLRLVLPRPLM